MVGIECDVAALTSFQEGLEGDRGRDGAQWCRLFNVIPRRSIPEIVFS